MSYLITFRNAISARIERFKQMVLASAAFGMELQVISVASLFAGVTLVFMIYIFTSILYEW